MTFNAQIWFWGIALAVFLALVWALSGVLLPFVAGLTVAYLLNPVVERLTCRGLNRTLATSVILGSFLVFVSIVLAITIPFAVRELTALISTIPDILTRAQMVLAEYIPAAKPFMTNLHIDDLPALLQGHAAQAFGITSGLATSLVSGGQAVVSMLAFVALMPVVAFYMMAQWPQMVAWIDNLLPRAHVVTIHDLMHQIDCRISGFIRGQIIVCFILAVYYALGLSLVGLQYGALIGFLAGVLSIIPFVGSIFGLGASIIIALFQVPIDGWTVLVLALTVFAVGQFAEGNFITPRIVGQSVGLHPLWIIFALLVGGSLMGLVGMLIAVPVAASVAVLSGFALDQYRKSVYYKGVGQIPV